MNAITEILRDVLPPGIEIPEDISEERLVQRRSDAFNAHEGKLTGYDCPKCKNKGYISEVVDRIEVMHRCDCHLVRESLDRIERSGLDKLCKRCTFDSFVVTMPWQEIVLNEARAYAANPVGWYALTGQSGSGKTHICTAITYTLIMNAHTGTYMLWTMESTQLKSLVGDAEAYSKRMNELRTSDVLYIDDLFKGSCTAADIKLAFDLLNSRAQSEKITIISSELTPEQLMNVDEALAGRIIEMCGCHYRCIKKNRQNNYRLRSTKL